MLKWSAIGAAHWFVFVGFYGLFLTLVEAFGEVWNPAFHLPLIGEFFLWNLFADIIGAGTILGILYLIYRRQKDHPRRQGRKSRFAGSNEGRGYFVEAVVLTVGICILLIRALKVSSDLTDAPGLVAPGLRRAGHRAARQPRPAHDRRVRQDRRQPDLARRHQPDPEHGRRLAPVQRLLQHLLQARGRRRASRSARCSR